MKMAKFIRFYIRIHQMNNFFFCKEASFHKKETQHCVELVYSRNHFNLIKIICFGAIKMAENQARYSRL